MDKKSILGATAVISALAGNAQSMQQFGNNNNSLLKDVMGAVVTEVMSAIEERVVVLPPIFGVKSIEDLKTSALYAMMANENVRANVQYVQNKNGSLSTDSDNGILKDSFLDWILVEGIAWSATEDNLHLGSENSHNIFLDGIFWESLYKQQKKIAKTVCILTHERLRTEGESVLGRPSQGKLVDVLLRTALGLDKDSLPKNGSTNDKDIPTISDIDFEDKLVFWTSKIYTSWYTLQTTPSLISIVSKDYQNASLGEIIEAILYQRQRIAAQNEYILACNQLHNELQNVFINALILKSMSAGSIHRDLDPKYRRRIAALSIENTEIADKDNFVDGNN